MSRRLAVTQKTHGTSWWDCQYSWKSLVQWTSRFRFLLPSEWSWPHGGCHDSCPTKRCGNCVTAHHLLINLVQTFHHTSRSIVLCCLYSQFCRHGGPSWASCWQKNWTTIIFASVVVVFAVLYQYFTQQWLACYVILLCCYSLNNNSTHMSAIIIRFWNEV